MERKVFEKLISRAIASLPQEFREKLTNIEIIIDDRPSAELRRRMDVPMDETLLGLFEGVPLTDRGFNSPLYPDRIWIFQQSIEEECETDAEIEEQIKLTVLHELAHFFGIDDDYLDEIGYG